MKKNINIIWGISFIIVGLIIGLNTLGVTNINLFFDGWWTLFIIVPNFINLFNENNKTASLIGLLIGVVLLLSIQNIIDFSLLWKLLLPIILIIIGISYLSRDLIGKEINKKIKTLNKNSKAEGYYATFGAQDLSLDDQDFNGGEVSAVFGGIKLDLRNAKIDSDVVINASSIFGGVELLIPENTKVVVKSTPIFGGVENRTKKINNTEAKTIYVNAVCVFGGVEIK